MTLSFWESLADSTHWSALLLTLALIGLCVVLHYEVLERLNLYLPRWRLPARPRVLLAIVFILLAHIAEIWLFGIGLYAASRYPSLGYVSGVDPFLLLDAIYLSAVTFTTVGYGDLVAHGTIRLLVGSEALTGFVLITWSASFTYLEMQRYWKPR